MGYRYSPSRPPTGPHTPGTPSQHPPARCHCRTGMSQEPNSAVGLYSVDQLSLYAHFSGFWGMTEAYNLAIAGNPNDHNLITGTE